MNYPTSSQYLANITIKNKEDSEDIFQTKGKFTTSGGFEMNMFDGAMRIIRGQFWADDV